MGYFGRFVCKLPPIIVLRVFSLLLIQFSQCVGDLQGKLVGQQDRGGQGMNERGAILQKKGNENNDRPHTEEVVVART